MEWQAGCRIGKENEEGKFNMNADERQIALSVIENLRNDILTAKTRDGHRILDTSDFYQYLTDRIDRIRADSEYRLRDDIDQSFNPLGAN
jgi:hypothetical protein